MIHKYAWNLCHLNFRQCNHYLPLNHHLIYYMPADNCLGVFSLCIRDKLSLDGHWFWHLELFLYSKKSFTNIRIHVWFDSLYIEMELLSYMVVRLTAFKNFSDNKAVCQYVDLTFQYWFSNHKTLYIDQSTHWSNWILKRESVDHRYVYFQHIFKTVHVEWDWRLTL